MADYVMEIELLSDLCVSDGAVYNSMLDIDVCYDSFGFPYIPAKRLRGCLRECALELQDWGMRIEASAIFGEEGNRAAGVRISDAHLEGYESMKKVVLENRQSQVLHPQNVLSQFTYIRTQTEISDITGIAKKGTLRTMRVIKKGLVFLANIDVPEDEQLKAGIKACCGIFKHMGIARTRGLGEISVTLKPVEKKIDEKEERHPDHAKLVEGAKIIYYQILLEEPVICKSLQGGESRTQDYIEGSKILGMVAGQMKKKGGHLPKLLDEGELFFSNAYPNINGVRLTEVPATYYQIKNNKKQYVDRAYETQENKRKTEDWQLEQMKHCYIGEYKTDGKCEMLKHDVKLENRYHHRRPEDKSIGYANAEDTDGSNFYQMSSIMAGQLFCGYISGTVKQINTIYKLLMPQTLYYIGFGRMSEYGRVKFYMTETGSGEPDKKLVLKDFLVKLESQTILYGNNAMYTTDPVALRREIELILGLESSWVESVEYFMRYDSSGGYNVTWQKKKPVINVFDKGTVLIFHLYQPAEVSVPKTMVLGERIIEGFGEASVIPLRADDTSYIRKLPETEIEGGLCLRADISELTEHICARLLNSYAEFHAMNATKEFNMDERIELNATVSNILLMCKDETQIEAIEENCRKRFNKDVGNKKQKEKNSADILNEVKRQCENLAEHFCQEYEIVKDSFSVEETGYRITYLKAYLTNLRYRIRQKGDVE